MGINERLARAYAYRFILENFGCTEEDARGYADKHWREFLVYADDAVALMQAMACENL